MAWQLNHAMVLRPHEVSPVDGLTKDPLCVVCGVPAPATVCSEDSVGQLLLARLAPVELQRLSLSATVGGRSPSSQMSISGERQLNVIGGP